MERRCKLCNRDITEESISAQIDLDRCLEFGPWEYDEEGSIQPPESIILAQGETLTLTKQGDWVHSWCDSAYGSGLTAEEMLLKFWKGFHRVQEG